MDRQPRPRRTPHPAPAVSLLAVGALLGAVATGAVLAREPSPTLPAPAGPGGTSTEPIGDPVPVGFTGDLAAGSCTDLLDHYVDTGLPLVGPAGWEPLAGDLPLPLAIEDGAGDALAAPAESSTSSAGASRSGVTAPGTPGTTRSTASATGTNVQEAGVDEPDSVKTDGRLLARVEDGELVLADVAGDRVRELSRTDLLDLEDLGGAPAAPGLEPTPAAAAAAELLLDGDRLMVLVAGSGAGTTGLTTLDVADPGEPRVLEQTTYDAQLVAATQHGDVVRIVLGAGLPDLDFVSPGGDVGSAEALRRNRELVRGSSVEDWLPERSVGGGDPTVFLDCAAVAVPDDDLPLGTTAVVGERFGGRAGADDGTSGTGPGSALGVAADLPLSYASADHLYLASGGLRSGWVDPVCLGLCRTVDPGLPDGTTHVHGFALDGVAASYVGAAEVDGHLADRWSMDEHDGVLRLAVEATAETADATSVVTLEPRDGELVEVGRLDGLGRGEDLTSVRWFDDLAVLVTFRRIDPLHTVDLSDPTTPTELGELEVPGFSSYLHPLGSQRLLGVGEGPGCPPGARCAGGWGAQAGLFDVTDLTDVRQLDVVGFGPGSRAAVAEDPRQLTWLPGRRTVLTVVVRGWRSPAAHVATLELGGGRLRSSLQRVERGAGVERVRTVPLPDERVVLVTGDDARFLDLTAG